MTASDKIVRSDVYQQIYPDHLMQQTFGTTTPTVSTRTAHFFDVWMRRRSNTYHLRGGDGRDLDPEVKSILRGMNLKEPWDYQLKGKEIRFDHVEDLAVFKIIWESK
jgi:hypothetical protein